jgi:hypothetical protein
LAPLPDNQLWGFLNNKQMVAGASGDFPFRARSQLRLIGDFMLPLPNDRKAFSSQSRMERGAVLSLMVAIALLTLQSARAADWPSSANHELTEKDCQDALFARDALLQDETLASWNIGVTVRSGLATLWGTVGSPALAHRAEERVRRVAGIAQVKNELRLADNSVDWDKNLDRAPSRPQPVVKEPAKKWDAPTPLVSREEPWANASRPTTSPPTLMPPIQVPAGRTESGSSGWTESVSSFGPAAYYAPSLIESVDRLRRSSERFRSVRFEVQGSVVRVWGANSGDVFAFAQQLSHQPGVQRVVIERTR